MSTERNSDKSSKSSISMTGIYFFVLLILEGIQRVSGIFFIETKYSLGSNRLLAVIPFALSRASAYIFGVALEPYRKKLKSETWVIVGSLISAIGLGLCFLTTDIIWWSVLWGTFGSGIGIASPSLVQKLKKKQNKTVRSALRLSGSSFGCVVFPFIVNIFIVHYGLNGCYIILAGLVLNCIPLTLVTIYCIPFRLPKPKWRLRKKSKTYEMSDNQDTENNVSQTNAIKTLSKESFICSMEPDTLHRVSDTEKHRKDTIVKDECIDIFKPITDAKINMAAEDLNKKIQEKLPCFKQESYGKEKLSELVTDIQAYEKDRMAFEDSFSNSDALSESPVDSSLKNGYLNSISKTSHKQTLSGCSYDDSEISAAISEKNHPSNSETNDEKLNTQTIGPLKPLKLNIPLEIKVHVVECTVTTSEECLETPPINLIPPIRPNAYRRHSNSLISGCYDNIDFTKMFQHKSNKSSPLHKLECQLTSRMFLISEDNESDSESRNSSSNDANDSKGLRVEDAPAKSKIQTFYRLAKPSCLVIVYTTVIFQFTLALLLTMFADFARDKGGTFWNSNFVLVAFGAGGIVGHLSFSFWGSRLLVDGSHAATAVILLLNGLAVAGILWSTNVCWLSGFFGLFGFIESGLLLTLPKLISDYIDRKAEKVLSLTCRSFCGVAMMCLPCVIGFSRDEIGEYDGLLQVTSCLSVMCAVLCYFLPRFTKRAELTSSQCQVV